MSFGERFRGNYFLFGAVAQVAVTLAGGVILFTLLLLGIPALRYYLWECFWRAMAASAPIGAAAVAATYRDNNALVAASHFHLTGRRIPRRFLARARAACGRLPLRLFILTLALLPADLIVIGAWIWAAGLIAPGDVVRGVLCGILYTPVHALIMFFAVRGGMRRMGEVLRASGVEWFNQRQSGLSIRFKLTASFICLAILPLLAGVVITDAQREWQAANRGIARLCGALDEVYASGSLSGTGPAAWEDAVAGVSAREGLPAETVFKAADGSGRLLAGGFDVPANRVWQRALGRKGPAGCWARPVPGERRFVAVKWFADPGVWVGAAADPYPASLAGVSRFAATAALAGLVFLAGAALGIFAARDLTEPLSELTAGVDQAARGQYLQFTGFLPDDELGGLAFSVNSLVGSFHRERGRMEAVVGEVRRVIAGLGELTERIQELGTRQHEIIEEQSSLSRQAEDDTDKVTRAAGEIKDRAGLIEGKMREVSRSAKDADDLTREVSGLMGDVAADAERTWQQMQMLEENYRRLEEVVRIIEDITGRTEMLAMNAELEASGRRDESGSRFGVVAAEVQRLSERIAEQTGQIGRLFREIRKSSLEMGQAIEEGRYRVAEGPALTKKLGSKLEMIDRRAADAARSMTEIAAMTAKQNQALEQMKFMVSEMHSVAGVINEVTGNADRSLSQLQKQAARLQELVTEAAATDAARAEDGNE